MNENRIYVVTGCYGGGKTEFCVNLALELRKRRNERQKEGKIYIADMDILNPYFRSREKEAFLKKHGIEIVGNSLNNNTGQDLPAVSFGFLSLISGGESVIIDLAGSVQGLRVLAGCHERIIETGSYEFLCVLNSSRPDMGDKYKMLDFVRSVKDVCELPVTGVVNNGHMLHETEAEHVLQSQRDALYVCETLNLAIKFTQLRRDIYNEIKDKLKSDEVIVFDKLQMRESWQ